MKLIHPKILWEELKKRREGRESVIHIFYQGEKETFFPTNSKQFEIWEKRKCFLIFGIKQIHLSKIAGKSVTAEQLFYLFISCLSFTEV